VLAEVVAELVAVAGAEVPSGLATVAPCETVVGAAALVDDAGGNPSGFETVAADAGGVAVAALMLGVDGVAGAGTLAPVAAGVEAVGALTVAERTFAVMLGDPAELGVEVAVAGVDAGVEAGSAAATAEFVTTLAGAAELFEATLGFSAVVGAGVILGPAVCAGPTLTLMLAGAALCGALEGGTVFTANSGLGALGAAAAV
jgi:hypothetical protein